MARSASPRRRRSPFHEALVTAFAARHRLADVSAATGVPRRTVQRWKADPENWAEVEAVRDECLHDAISQLRQGLPRVAERLLKVALSDTESSSITVRAAQVVFDIFNDLSARAEIEQRLAALEAALRRAPSLIAQPAAAQAPSPTMDRDAEPA
jgi:hypothetical protein